VITIVKSVNKSDPSKLQVNSIVGTRSIVPLRAQILPIKSLFYNWSSLFDGKSSCVFLMSKLDALRQIKPFGQKQDRLNATFATHQCQREPKAT